MIQFQLDIIRRPLGFFKICETAITILILSIAEGIPDFEYGSENLTFYCGGVFIMSMVVTPLMFYTFFRGYSPEIQKTPLELHINIFLTVNMIIAGSLILNAYCTAPLKHKSFADAGKTVGSFGIINGIFYFADTFFAHEAFKGREY